jgi:hypothetical protein
MPQLLFSISSGLLSAQGIALAGNVLAIADTGNNQIAFFDIAALPGSAPVRTGGLGTNPAVEGLRLPKALQFTAANELIVADTYNQHLDRYQRTGTVWTYQNSFAQFPGIAPPVGYIVDLVADGSNGLLFLDVPARRILHIDLATGAVTSYFTDTYWSDPAAITLGNGYLWVADAGRHQVFRYDPAFTRLAIGGYGTAPGKLRAPRGLAFEATTGILYVAEADGARISIFTTGGQPAGNFALPSGSAHELHKLALDPATRHLYVADAGASRIHVFDLAGTGAGLSLNEQTLDFGSVALGYRLRLGIGMRNNGTTAVQVTTLATLGSEYALEPLNPTTPFTISPGSQCQVMVRYAPATPGASFGRLKIETDSPAQPTLFAELTGEGLLVEPMSLALVLDRSGSMSLSSGSMSKIERLRAACALLIDLLSSSGQDELAMISFSTNATTDLTRTPLSPGTITSAQNKVSGIQAFGMTSIGDGLRSGFAELSRSLITRRNVIVLTDGQENTSPMIADITVPADTNIFTVGLGLPQFLDTVVLERLATAYGGYFQITDGNDQLLAKFFVQIFSDLVGQQVAIDPPIRLQTGQTQEFTVEVCSGDSELSAVLTWENRGSRFDIELVRPDGVLLTRGDFGWLAERDRHLAIRMPLRGTRWEQPGRWTARVRAVQTVAGSESGMLSLLVSSDYHLDWDFRVIQQERREFEPPEDVFPSADFPSISSSQGVSAPPPGLHLGDRLGLEVGLALPASDVTVVSGFLDVRAPKTSLALLRQQFAGIDLDTLEESPWPRFPDEQPRWRRVRFNVDKQRRLAYAELSLNGPDGIYEVRAHVNAVTVSGERLQRERSFHLVVSK